MNHEDFADRDMVGRYMSGTLSVDERARFEEHFIDCPQCLDALENLDRFRSALRSVASEAAVHHAAMGARTRAWWTSPAARIAGVAAVVVIAIGGLDLIRTRRELTRVAALSDGLGRQYLDAESRVREMSKQVQSLQRTEQPESQSSAPVFPLTRVRSAGAGAPPNRVTLSGTPEWVVLLAEVDAAPASRYRATLRTMDGRQVWSDDQLLASTPDTLGISLRAAVLSTGDYVLTVEEHSPHSTAWTPAGRFTFRVAATR